MHIDHTITAKPSIAELLAREADEQARWETFIPAWHPRNEGEDDDDNDDDDAGTGDNDDDDDDDATKAGAGGGNDDDDDDADDDGDKIKVSKKEYQALRAAEAKRRREEARRQKQAKKDAQKKKADEGRLQEVIDEKDEELKEKDAEVNEWKGKYESLQSSITIGKVAKRLNFEDPEDAEVYFDRYRREGEERTDEKHVETVLKRILKDKPKLKSKRSGSGAPLGSGNGANGLFTHEEIQRMTPEEINANYEKVEKSLAALGTS